MHRAVNVTLGLPIVRTSVAHGTAFDLAWFTLNFSPEGLGWAKDIGWLKPVGAIGITMAFGHSLLAMSGEESLAQVYREMEAPKIKNLERTGLVIFVYAMPPTSLVSFFAVMIIPGLDPDFPIQRQPALGAPVRTGSDETFGRANFHAREPTTKRRHAEEEFFGWTGGAGEWKSRNGT